MTYHSPYSFSFLSLSFFKSLAQLHVVAVGHTWNISGSSSGSFGQFSRLIKNNVKVITLFDTTSREKRALLTANASGVDYEIVKETIHTALDDGFRSVGLDNLGEKPVGAHRPFEDYNHPAVTFQFPSTSSFRSRFLNFRETNKAEDPPLLSILVHKYFNREAAPEVDPSFSRLDKST